MNAKQILEKLNHLSAAPSGWNKLNLELDRKTLMNLIKKSDGFSVEIEGSPFQWPLLDKEAQEEMIEDILSSKWSAQYMNGAEFRLSFKELGKRATYLHFTFKQPSDYPATRFSLDDVLINMTESRKPNMVSDYGVDMTWFYEWLLLPENFKRFEKLKSGIKFNPAVDEIAQEAGVKTWDYERAGVIHSHVYDIMKGRA